LPELDRSEHSPPPVTGDSQEAIATRRVEKEEIEQGSRTQVINPTTLPRTSDLVQTSDDLLKNRLVSGTGEAVGRFVVQSHLDQGGMGMLFRALDEELNRPVALKILRPQFKGTASRIRLLREAQALAKLSHPNVVTVYEVGEWDGHVFMAMELIEGQTLRAWLRLKPWSWREIVEKLVQAGRGLAAAHDAGIIHRDFKPSNVFVGTDGRVRVLDFGLAFAPVARAEGTDEEESVSLPSSDLLSAPLTVAGAIAGTPPYMAPEQLLDHKVDARADQYAFCITLYEGLYGQRPFTGRSAKERCLELVSTPEPVFPKKPRVPAHLRKILRRGLRARPDLRYESMTGLLADLAKDPVRRRRRLLAGSAASIILLGGGYEIAHRQAAMSDPCAPTGALAESWSSLRGELESALLGVEKDYTERVWQHLDAELVNYVDTWEEEQVAACRARRSGAYDTELYGTALSCLKQRRFAFEALLDTLIRADKGAVAQALQAADALPSLARCNDVDALTATTPPPEDPTIAAEVERLRETLAQANAELQLNRHAEGLALSSEVVARAEELAYVPLQTEALAIHGRLQMLAGSYKDSEETLTEALWLADLIRDDEHLALTMASLIRCVGEQLGDYERAMRMRRHAEIVIRRLGGNTYGEARILQSMGTIESRKGSSEEAIDLSGRSLAIVEALYGPEDRRVISFLVSHGVAYASDGQFARSEELYRRALAIGEAKLGPGHPELAWSINNIGSALGNQGDDEGALPYFERSLKITESVYGQEHPAVAKRLANIGLVHISLGHLDEALAYLERSLEIEERFRGPDHVFLARRMGDIGEVLHLKGDYEDARSYLERAHQILEKKVEPQSWQFPISWHRLGAVNYELGDDDIAIPYLERAYEALSKKQDRSNPTLTRTSLYLGQAYKRSKRLEHRGQWRFHTEEALAGFRELGEEERVAAIEAWLEAPDRPFNATNP